MFLIWQKLYVNKQYRAHSENYDTDIGTFQPVVGYILVSTENFIKFHSWELAETGARYQLLKGCLHEAIPLNSDWTKFTCFSICFHEFGYKAWFSYWSNMVVNLWGWPDLRPSCIWSFYLLFTEC